MARSQPKHETNCWTIGIDGWPLDRSHPVYRETEAEWRARRLAEDLATCERAWYSGSLLALADAVILCSKAEQSLPDWTVRAVVKILAARFSGKDHKRRGRLARLDKAHRQDMIHYTRWDAVTELRDRQPELASIARTWVQTYEAVSELLEGTLAAGSAKTIQNSYQLVQRAMRKKKGAGQYYIPSRSLFDTNRLG